MRTIESDSSKENLKSNEVYQSLYSEKLFILESIENLVASFENNHKEIFSFANSILNKGNNSDNLYKAQNEIKKIYHDIESQFILKAAHEPFSKLSNIAHELAKEQDKELDVIIEKTDLKINESEYGSFFDNLIHLIRNCVDHGIESKERRKTLNKKEKGVIKVSFEKEGRLYFSCVISDDGRGIDPGLIRERAQKLERLSREPLMSMKDEELIQIIFEPGFSTRDKVSQVSGRGVGMDVIKKSVLELEGDVSVNSNLRGDKFNSNCLF